MRTVSDDTVVGSDEINNVVAIKKTPRPKGMSVIIRD
jgi:hypothetical protein